MKLINKVLPMMLIPFILCSCFPKEELNYVDSNSQTESSAYSESDLKNINIIKEKLQVKDGTIKGNPDELINVDIEEKIYSKELCPFKFSFYSFTEQKLESVLNSSALYEKRNITEREQYDDDIYEGYKVTVLESDRDSIISGPGWIKYNTADIYEKDVNMIVSYDSSGVREDIDRVFPDKVPDIIDQTEYIRKSGEILSEFNIPYSGNPAVYYLNRENLSVQYTLLTGEEKDYNSDYVLLYYNDFIYNDSEIYNSYVNWNYSGYFSGCGFYVIINADSGKIEFFKGDGLLDKETVSPLTSTSDIISLSDAVSRAVYKYTKIINTNEVCISEANLKYVPVNEKKDTIMIPCWVINAELSADVWNEKANEFQKKSETEIIFVNALNGMVMS